eukprot:CAMPEP_0173323656 /NCGR_PEP_ID=MMETSP1143-20121109/30637_1 /TAXON_ID=483371 /ORGANISM="non described non described, Strain CCMP2298" /LENGTH=58 /DNA_ID=CAMNT_0014267643 /DNA_START=1129 /DNA_END=1304 /DNA_ORIENTATION=+
MTTWDREDEDDGEEEAVVGIDGQTPGPAAVNRYLAVGVIRSRAVQKKRLNQANALSAP